MFVKELLRQSKSFLEEYEGQGKITQEKKDEILEALSESFIGKGFFDSLSKKLGIKVDINDKESLRKMIEKKGLNFDELWSDYMTFLGKTTKNVKAKQRLIKKNHIKKELIEEFKEEYSKLQKNKGSLENEILTLEKIKSELEENIAGLNATKSSLEEANRSSVHELLERFNQDGRIGDVSVLDSFKEQPDWIDLSMKQKIERFSELLFSSGIAKTEKIELGKKVTITIPGEKEITLMFSTRGDSNGNPRACPRHDEIIDDDIENRSNNNAKKFGLMCKAEGCEMLSEKTVKKICGILYELFEKLGRNNKNNINLDKDLYTFAIILFQSLGSDPRGIRLSDKNLRTDYGGKTLYSLLYYPRENGNMCEIIGLCDCDFDQRYLAFCKIGYTNLR